MPPKRAGVEKEIKGFGTEKNDVLDNKAFRRVVYTHGDDGMQVVFMSLGPKEMVDLEKHNDTDQIVQVVYGTCRVKVGTTFYKVKRDGLAIIPRGEKHYIKNSSGKKDLKIVVIYSKALHGKSTVQSRKPNA